MTKNLTPVAQNRIKYSQCGLFTYATVGNTKLTFFNLDRKWAERKIRFTPNGGQPIPDSAVLLSGIPLAYT